VFLSDPQDDETRGWRKAEPVLLLQNDGFGVNGGRGGKAAEGGRTRETVWTTTGRGLARKNHQVAGGTADNRGPADGMQFHPHQRFASLRGAAHQESEWTTLRSHICRERI